MVAGNAAFFIQYAYRAARGIVAESGKDQKQCRMISPKAVPKKRVPQRGTAGSSVARFFRFGACDEAAASKAE